LLVRREAERRPAESAAPDIAAAVDERVEHQFEKLVGLKHCALAAGCGLAVELRERIRQAPTGQAKNVDKSRRQRPLVESAPKAAVRFKNTLLPL